MTFQKQLVLSLTLLMLVLSFLNLNAQELVGKAADDMVKGAETVLLKEGSSIPAYLVFQEENRIPAEQFENWEKTTFGINNDLTFEYYKEKTDQFGILHRWRKQYYKGVFINGAISVVHYKEGKVSSVSGSTYEMSNLSIEPSISREAALNTSLESLGIAPADWRHTQFVTKHLTLNNKMAEYEIESIELVIDPINADKVLAWRVALFSYALEADQVVYIDAQTGELLGSQSYTLSCNLGTVNTTWRGMQQFLTDQVGGQFILFDDCAPRDIRTTDLLFNDFQDNDNNWNPANLTERGAATAHWAIGVVDDYFEGAPFNRAGIDDNNTNLDVTIQPGLFNAFYFIPGPGDDERISFGLGGNVNGADDFTTLDIAGHEYGHGIHISSGMNVNTHESGALAEGFADIMGNMVEWDFEGFANVDWEFAEGIAGIDQRNLNDPNNDDLNSPDTYLQPGFWSGTLVHTDGGVLRHWFFLLSEGGNGTNGIGNAFNVNGIGINNAMNIIYNTVSTGGAAGDPNHHQMRAATIQQATNMFGACSNQANAVRDAWHAVGVGANSSVQLDWSISNAAFSPTGSFSPSDPITLSYRLRNNTATNAGTYIGFYISPDCTFGNGNDTYMGWDYTSLNCATLSGTQTFNATIPSGLASGNYYILYVADFFNISVESNENNNVSCRFIQITNGNPQPDLSISSQTASPTTLFDGQATSTSCRVYNYGTANASYVTVGYYLSTNTTFGSGDIFLTSGAVYNVYANGSYKTLSRSVTIPAGTAPGNYYLLFVADPYDNITELNENNNVRYRSITVQSAPTGQPDLVVENISPSFIFANCGQTITVNSQVRNIGGASTGSSSTMYYYLSSDNVYNSGDTYVGQDGVPTLAANASSSESVTFTVNTSPPNGAWHLIMVADRFNSVAESIETNNEGDMVIVMSGSSGCLTGEDPGTTSLETPMATEALDDQLETPKGQTDNDLGQGIDYRGVNNTLDLKLYPNPTQGMFQINYPIQEKDATIYLQDLNGRTLQTLMLAPDEQTGALEMDATGLPTGLYLVRMLVGDQQMVKKLVIE